MSSYSQATRAYRAGRLIGAPPVDLIVMAYSEAIQGCHERDVNRASNAIMALSDTLNYDDQTDLAVNLFRLYEYCGKLVRKGEFDRAARLLSEVREAWASTRTNAASDGKSDETGAGEA